MAMLQAILRYASGRQDIVFACFFVIIVGMLVLPVPTPLIDVLLVINLALALTILLAAMYLKRTLDLSSFPSILLISTVFRLALTVSTTRLVLSQGDAGQLISGFGHFVVAGNVVVGLVMFLIIAVVQFIVITKGAERIAEVGARFTLDALPGKQLSIDADVRNGEISKEEAHRRRFDLEKESQFFGAMDGAMRFVKGDAIASLIVVFVNLLGGIAIGTLQKGMSFGEAAHLYSLLTVGDGLVAQIPAMFMAVAAGTVVTRVATEDAASLGDDIARQLVAEPRALAIAGVFIGALAAVPGFPRLAFLAIGGLLILGAILTVRARLKSAEAVSNVASAAQEQVRDFEAKLQPAGLAHVIVVRGPTSRIDALDAEGLPQALAETSKEVSARLGFSVPKPGFARDDRRGDLWVEVDGVPVGPIANADDRIADIAASLAQLQIRFASRLFGTPEATAWLEEARPELFNLVGEVQQALPQLRLVEILRRLLDETVPLVQRRLILEALLQHAGAGAPPEQVADQIRLSLRRQICHALAESDGTIPVVIAGPEVEDYFRSSGDPGASTAASGASAALIEQVRQLPTRPDGRLPTVLSAGDVRRKLRQFLSTHGFDVPVVAYAELVAEFQPRPLGTLTTQAP
jgi:type III secretion protein V